MIENLTQTKELMESKDYKERFIAEYWQNEIRLRKLKNFLAKVEAKELYDCDDSRVYEERVSKCVQHDCPLQLLRHQAEIMEEYLRILRIRAVFESIELDYYKKNEGGKC